MLPQVAPLMPTPLTENTYTKSGDYSVKSISMLHGLLFVCVVEISARVTDHQLAYDMPGEKRRSG